MNSDPWLEPWLPLVAQHVGHSPILELGCGRGLDTAVLAAHGHRVVAIDLSASSLAKAKLAAPSCEFHCQDIRAPFPAPPGSIGVVVASLSLHYFPWPETLALAQRIRDVLAPAGFLLCRLNSTNDHNYGASGHQAIDGNYYLVNGEPKRFFSEPAVRELFASGWHVHALQEKVIQRYAHAKHVWEAVLARAA